MQCHVLGVAIKIISKCNVNRAITGCNLNSNIEYIIPSGRMLHLFPQSATPSNCGMQRNSQIFRFDVARRLQLKFLGDLY